jgi:hypothetical protein
MKTREMGFVHSPFGFSKLGLEGSFCFCELKEESLGLLFQNSKGVFALFQKKFLEKETRRKRDFFDEKNNNNKKRKEIFVCCCNCFSFLFFVLFFLFLFLFFFLFLFV